MLFSLVDYVLHANSYRTILVGIGLLKVDTAREAFFDMMELLQKVL